MMRVAIWNDGLVPDELGGGTRGNNEFKPGFDLGLLSEEVKEFYKAMANNDLVEMVDAYCDVRFVWEGIEFKYGMISYSYETNSDLKVLEVNEKAFEQLEKYYIRHEHKMFKILNRIVYSTDRFNSPRYIKAIDNNVNCFSYKETKEILDEAFNIVCEANEQKGTIKDSKGKTMKGPKWVNPADRIKALLIDEGILQYSNNEVIVKVEGIVIPGNFNTCSLLITTDSREIVYRIEFLQNIGDIRELIRSLKNLTIQQAEDTLSKIAKIKEVKNG